MEHDKRQGFSPEMLALVWDRGIPFRTAGKRWTASTVPTFGGLAETRRESPAPSVLLRPRSPVEASGCAVRRPAAGQSGFGKLRRRNTQPPFSEHSTISPLRRAVRPLVRMPKTTDTGHGNVRNKGQIAQGNANRERNARFFFQCRKKSVA